ncbi:hypothetical protein J5N97_030090 [Dioscorea zingiberensis]|uniref:Protein KAKU4 n=1 Tax=Dioscorea zingiberensis TaxID=325984 RepID=A0A9D5BX25_9LILI|nr:hypothetical protein J5N97_030090 [Dioscorea zingiberensis]
MASQSRACLALDGGAGAPPPLRRQSGWLSDLISGAGRLISSVLDSPYSSSEEDDLLSEEGEDSEAFSKDLVDLNQSGKNLEQAMDNMDRSLAIVTKVHSKDAIAQLLVQETFSRDECDKLTKIIQSRVVDTVADGRYVAQKELLNRTISNIISSPDARWSMDLSRDLPEKIPYCSPSLSPLSPVKWLLHGPDLHNTAVMEAKKWLDEKSSSNSKCDLNCSPCNLNTDVPQYYVGGEVGTPVELAKSYMQSLQPWQSPFSSKSWKGEMYNAYQIYKDETSSPTTNHLFSSSKDLKRKFQASESRDTLDEIRRIRMKLMNNRSECSYFHQLNFSARLLEASSPIGRSDTDVPGAYQIPVPTTEAAAEHRDMSDKLSSKISDEDHCLDEAFMLNVEAAVDTNYPVFAASIDINLDGVETVNVVSPANGNLPVNLPVEPAEYYSGVGDEPVPCEPAVVLCEELGLKERLQIDGQDSVLAPCDSTCLALTSNKHDGETVKCSQPITVPTEETKSVPSDADQTSSAHISSGEGETVRVEKSSQLHLGSNCKDSDTVIDTGSHEGNYQIHKAANDFANENNVNCSSTGLVTVQVVGYAGHRHPTNPDNGELGSLGIPDGPFQATTGEVPLETNVGTGKSRNGMTMRSIKRMLTESKSTSRPKERKTTGRPRRSKAKAKGQK